MAKKVAKKKPVRKTASNGKTSLSIKELADREGVAVATVRDWINAKKIVSNKDVDPQSPTFGSWRIPVASFKRPVGYSRSK